MILRTTLLGLLFASAFPSICPAPICGAYPGIHQLIEDSDYIITATIAESLDDHFSGHGKYKVFYRSILKGPKDLIDFERMPQELQLRNLPYSPISATGSNNNHTIYNFLEYETLSNGSYLLFLEGTNELQSVNVMGNTWKIGASRLPSELQNKDVYTQISYFLSSYTNYCHQLLLFENARYEAIIKELHQPNKKPEGTP